MTLHRMVIAQKWVMSIGGILLAILLAGTLAFLMIPRLSPHAFASMVPQKAGIPCAQQPTMEHCNNQDPQLQGCATDARSLSKTDIVENGRTIGRVERRWSDICQSWWGRVFDNRPGSHANMYITIDGTTLSAPPTFVTTTYRILYSSMVFDASPTQTVPEITGTLEIDGIITPPGATLPAISIPQTTQSP